MANSTFEDIEREIAEAVRFVDSLFGIQDQPTSPPSITATPAPKKKKAIPATDNPSDPYDLAYLNTDIDWATQLPRLNPEVQGSFCFHGLPGTGKSLLGKKIAEHLNRPLMLKRGSDFLAKYIGETESHLADAFREARDTGSVLVIDEIDGLMFSREGATRSWELTQVNELLCQMEDFTGLFIGTTNHLKWLDSASLRRFSLKCEFRGLTVEQRVALFEHWLQQGLAASHKKAGKGGDKHRALASIPQTDQLAGMNNLTPGDFKAAVRRLSLFSKTWSGDDLCHQLGEECKAKPGFSRPIGFMQ